jgi:hypothetical protein
MQYAFTAHRRVAAVAIDMKWTVDLARRRPRPSQAR